MTTFALAILLFLQSTTQQQAGTITGQIRLPDGTPAVGIRVAAIADTIATAALGETDASGRFRLQNILPGRYVIGAGLLASPTYYPGVTGFDAARTVSISANSTIEGIDFTVQRVSLGFQISGRIPNLPKDVPAELFRLELSRNPPASGPPLPNVLLESNGTFKASRVPLGGYDVRLVANGRSINRDRLDVINQDLSGVELKVPPTLIGKVEVESGGSLPTQTRVEARGTVGASGGSASARTDGFLALFLTPGEYRFAVTYLPYGYYLKGMSSGSVDLLRQTLKVGEATPEPLRLALTRTPPDSRSAGVTITGHVIGLSAEAAATERWVSASSRTPAFESSTGFQFQREGQAPLRPDGTFELAHVLPGTVTLTMRPRINGAHEIQESVEVEDQNLEVTLGVRARIPIQVVDESGRGIEGARVAIVDGGYSPIAKRRVGPSAEAPEYLTTGSDGRTTFDDTLGNSQLRILVVAYAPGKHAARSEEVSLDQAMKDGVRLVMNTGIEVKGQLADSNGNALPKALTLWVRSESTDHDGKEAWPYFYRVDTDSQGRFRIAGLHPGRYEVRSEPGGGTLALAFRQEDAWPRFGDSWSAPSQEPFEILDGLMEIRADDALKTLRVSFEPREMSGVVTDESGKNVAGATVHLYFPANQEKSITTDSEGRFNFKIQPAEYIALMASHPDFGINRDYLYAEDKYRGKITQDPIRLVLRRGFEIRGTLLDPAGKPLPNTPLELIPGYMGSGPLLISTTSDERGHFSFGRIWVENFRFHLNYDKLGHLPLDFVGAYRQLVDEDNWFSELKAGHEITLKTRDVVSVPVIGTFHDSEGKPLPPTSYRIEIQREENGQMRFVLGTDGKTDRDGQFRLGLWQGETYELRFDVPSGQEGVWKGSVSPGGVSGIRVTVGAK